MNIEFIITHFVMLLIGVLVPLAIQWFKAVSDKKDRLKQVRINEYRTYINSLEKISKVSTQEMQKMFSSSLKEFYDVLENDMPIETASMKFQQDVFEQLAQLGEMIATVKEQLNGLKLFSTETLYVMIVEYQNYLESNVEKFQEFLRSVNMLESSPLEIANRGLNIDGHIDLDAPLEKIIRQMRIELDIK